MRLWIYWTPLNLFIIVYWYAQTPWKNQETCTGLARTSSKRAHHTWLKMRFLSTMRPLGPRSLTLPPSRNITPHQCVQVNSLIERNVSKRQPILRQQVRVDQKQLTRYERIVPEPPGGNMSTTPHHPGPSERMLVRNSDQSSWSDVIGDKRMLSSWHIDVPCNLDRLNRAAMNTTVVIWHVGLNAVSHP